MSILTVEHVCKSFDSHHAVQDVSFEINQGDIVGFLGKNGAGKTTLMRIISTFLAPSSGRVFIDGDDISKHDLIVRQKIGYLPETPPLYPNMTVSQYLKFAAEIKDVASKKLSVQLTKTLEDCQLTHVKDKVISMLSKGYKQRVGIAQAIIHEPKLLILDEPTSGLDPMQVQQVLALINSQREQRTVLLSTHTLPEIEKIAQRILMLKSGQLMIDQPLDILLKGSENRANPITLEQIFIDHHQEQSSLQNGRHY